MQDEFCRHHLHVDLKRKLAGISSSHILLMPAKSLSWVFQIEIKNSLSRKLIKKLSVCQD
jgi:hypothetical protein